MKLFQTIVILTVTAACLLLALFTDPVTNRDSAVISDPIRPTTPFAEGVVKDEALQNRDVNGDGVVDSLSICQDGGSLYGGNYLTIIDGGSQKTYSADDADFYGAAISVCAINIGEPMFARAAEELLLPKEVRQVVDPMGDWVVGANSKKRILSDNPHFEMVSKPRLTWVDDKTIPAADYCVKVTAAKGRQYLKNRARHADEEFGIQGVSIARKTDSVWLVWRGYRFRQEPLREVARSAGGVIFANSNCVGIEREDGRFAWLVVNDECLIGRTGGGIESLEVQNGLILLELAAPKGVVVDVQTGKVASLRPYPEQSPFDDSGKLTPLVIQAFKTL